MPHSIGDRVQINHQCVEEYWGITGTIKEMLPKDPDPCNGHLVNYVEFDTPLGTLKGEYFASKELDKLTA